MNDEQLNMLGKIIAKACGLKPDANGRYALTCGNKSGIGLVRTIATYMTEMGATVELGDEDFPDRAISEFQVTGDSISYTERGFFIGFANKHVAKDAMNEILHAFDEAGMDKSNLVGDVLFGISEQLDEAFGNEDWDDKDQA